MRERDSHYIVSALKDSVEHPDMIEFAKAAKPMLPTLS
jgi:hypothetical protein